MPDALSWPFPWHFESGPQGSRTILVSSQGGNSLSYSVSGDASLGIEAVSVDVDATSAGLDLFVQAQLTDQSGLLLARVVTGLAITAGNLAQVTFAPQLPDSSTFDSPFPRTQIQAGLWEVEAEQFSVVTVTALTSFVVLTEMRLLVFDVEGPSGEISSPVMVHGTVGA